MSYRETQNRLAFQKQLEAEENEAKIERERPFREAEEQLRQSSIELGKLTRERILSGKDDDFQPCPTIANARMTTAAASDFNAEQFSLFADTTAIYLNEANTEKITDYLWNQHIQISNAETFRRAAERLSDYGLLELAPAPEPLAEPIPDPVEQRHPVNDGYETGIDQTGAETRHSPMQIAAMTADQYRRWKQIPSLNRNRPSNAPIR
jgi:hypothetical protein